MYKLADISMLENLQRAQNERMGYGHLAVFNDYSENAYSEEEAERRVQMCETEIAKVEHEITAIQQEFLRAHNSYNFQHYLDEKYAANKSRRTELGDRIGALKNRIKQIQDTDTEGAFSVPCFEIEEKLKEFIGQLGQTVDNPQQRNVHNESSSRSLSGLSVFNSPSK